jgi:hypothetical protein
VHFYKFNILKNTKWKSNMKQILIISLFLLPFFVANIVLGQTEKGDYKTTNQLLIGEKHIPPSRLGKCAGTGTEETAYAGDCSFLPISEWGMYAIS